MIDLYLRFADQAEMLSVLEPLGMTTTDDEGVVKVSQGGHQYALWEVGEIPAMNTVDPVTGDVSVPWHLNVRQIDMELDLSALEPFRVYPPYPVCVWA